MTVCIMAECFYTVSFMLTVMYVECRKLTLYAECHYRKCHYAECHYAECHNVECCGANITEHNDTHHNGVPLISDLLSLIRLNVVRSSVVLPNVVAPCRLIQFFLSFTKLWVELFCNSCNKLRDLAPPPQTFFFAAK
jgi:hypothetical protein